MQVDIHRFYNQRYIPLLADPLAMTLPIAGVGLQLMVNVNGLQGNVAMLVTITPPAKQMQQHCRIHAAAKTDENGSRLRMRFQSLPD